MLDSLIRIDIPLFCLTNVDQGKALLEVASKEILYLSLFLIVNDCDDTWESILGISYWEVPGVQPWRLHTLKHSLGQ